jgi:hypothetical protein
VHFARINTLAGRYAIAQAHLNAITNEIYADLKKRLTRNLVERQSGTNAASAPPAPIETKPPEKSMPAARSTLERSK